MALLMTFGQCRSGPQDTLMFTCFFFFYSPEGQTQLSYMLCKCSPKIMSSALLYVKSSRAQGPHMCCYAQSLHLCCPIE